MGNGECRGTPASPFDCGRQKAFRDLKCRVLEFDQLLIAQVRYDVEHLLLGLSPDAPLSIIAVEDVQIIRGNLPQALNGLLANVAVIVDRQLEQGLRNGLGFQVSYA